MNNVITTPIVKNPIVIDEFYSFLDWFNDFKNFFIFVCCYFAICFITYLIIILTIK